MSYSVLFILNPPKEYAPREFCRYILKSDKCSISAFLDGGTLFWNIFKCKGRSSVIIFK